MHVVVVKSLFAIITSAPQTRSSELNTISGTAWYSSTFLKISASVIPSKNSAGIESNASLVGANNVNISSLRASPRPAAIVNSHNVLNSGSKQTSASLQIKEKEGRKLLVTFIVSSTNFEGIIYLFCRYFDTYR